MAIIANLTLVVLALALGVRLLTRYTDRPQPHTLWYALGLVLTASAAFSELYYEISGEIPSPLWWLYWSCASATVGYLGVGTAYLIGPRFGRTALITATALSLWVVAATLLTSFDGPGAAATVADFHKAPTGAIKLPFVLQNILGSLVIIGGAVLSYVRTRGFYNVLIAAGTLVFASGGAAAGLVNFPGIFYFTQTAGIVLLYFGVHLSLGRRPALQKAV